MQVIMFTSLFWKFGCWCGLWYGRVLWMYPVGELWVLRLLFFRRQRLSWQEVPFVRTVLYWSFQIQPKSFICTCPSTFTWMTQGASSIPCRSLGYKFLSYTTRDLLFSIWEAGFPGGILCRYCNEQGRLALFYLGCSWYLSCEWRHHSWHFRIVFPNEEAVRIRKNGFFCCQLLGIPAVSFYPSTK